VNVAAFAEYQIAVPAWPSGNSAARSFRLTLTALALVFAAATASPRPGTRSRTVEVPPAGSSTLWTWRCVS